MALLTQDLNVIAVGEPAPLEEGGDFQYFPSLQQSSAYVEEWNVTKKLVAKVRDQTTLFGLIGNHWEGDEAATVTILGGRNDRFLELSPLTFLQSGVVTP